MTQAAQIASTERFALAEGPVWDAARGRLLWVDILGGSVLEGHLGGQAIEVTRRHTFDCMVGAVAVAADGTLLVAAQEKLVFIRPDGSREDGPEVVPSGSQRRCNDGATDPAGRFLVGTLPLDGASECEELLRLDDNGMLSVLDDDLTLSNGLAWTADGRVMFSVDTRRRLIYCRAYDPVTGLVGERAIHLELTDGYPDGIAMDEQNHLWVAVWGAGEIRRFAPDGLMVDRVTVPAPHTSSVAFAGDDLGTLVVTTATAELESDQLQRFPLSGHLFTCEAPVPGLPLSPWSPTTTFSH